MRNTIPFSWTWLEQTAAPKRSTCTRLLQITARAGCERSVEGYFLVSLTVKGPAGICAAVPPSVSENQQLNEWHQTECATHCVSRILACQWAAGGKLPSVFSAQLFLGLGHSRRAVTIWVSSQLLGASRWSLVAPPCATGRTTSESMLTWSGSPSVQRTASATSGARSGWDTPA